MRPLLCRPFSTTHALREQGADALGSLDDETNHQKRSKDVYYRHINPSGRGRIIGKPGRKQQQSSEPLAIESLGERSEVIVLRDVYEDKVAKHGDGNKAETGEHDGADSAGTKPGAISAEDLQAALAETEATPDDKEVYASIHALQPESPFLEQKDYDDLLNQLLDGYNIDQLSRYLHTFLAAQHTRSGSSRSIAVFRTSRWAPGRTSIEKRRLRKTTTSSKGLASTATKTRVADKILRLGWELKVHSEEQMIGELEMQLLPWHIALLFDLQKGRQPMCMALLENPLLVRNSEVTPYRPSNIMRITARRQDAEEIARQLEQKLMRTATLTLDLERVRPLIAAHYAGKQWSDIFRTRDINIISKATKSIIELPDNGQVNIYSFGRTTCMEAARLLLSLLGLAESQIEPVTLEPEQRVKRKGKASIDISTLIPVFSDAELHLRHRAKPWYRATQPLRKLSPDPMSNDQNVGTALAHTLKSRLSSLFDRPTLEPYHKSLPEHQEGSYWSQGLSRYLASGSWYASLGMRLLPSTASTPSPPTFLSHVPSLEPLITHFTPTSTKPARLCLHFYPSPFERLSGVAFHELPKLQLFLELPTLNIQRLYAYLHQQAVDIPLPALDTDIRIHRNASFQAKSSLLEQDPAVKIFLDSVRASATTPGPLRAPRDLSFRLPNWLLGTKQGLDVKVQYLFSHVEQISGTDFEPTAEVRGEGGVLAGWPEDLRLSLRDIDGGGVVGGKRLEMSLKRLKGDGWEGVVGAAMGVAKLITKVGREGRVFSGGKEVRSDL